MGNNRPTLYIGITNNLINRIYQHKFGIIEGFTKKYKLNKLLYFEVFTQVDEALLREKRLKHWERQWKLDLIKKKNSALRDLYNNLIR